MYIELNKIRCIKILILIILFFNFNYNNSLAIESKIVVKINDKIILKAWAQSVQPSDNYKWKTKAEENWLEKKKMKS